MTTSQAGKKSLLVFMSWLLKITGINKPLPRYVLSSDVYHDVIANHKLFEKYIRRLDLYFFVSNFPLLIAEGILTQIL